MHKLLARDFASVSAISDAFRVARKDTASGREYDHGKSPLHLPSTTYHSTEMLLPLVDLSNWLVRYIEHLMLQLILYHTSSEHVLFQIMENKESFRLSDSVDIVCTERNGFALENLKREFLFSFVLLSIHKLMSDAI